MNDYLARKIIIGLKNFRMTPAEAWKNLCESRDEITDEMQDEIECLIVEHLQEDEDIEMETLELENYFDSRDLENSDEEMDWSEEENVEDWIVGNDVY
jgi:hypothetical protein